MLIGSINYYKNTKFCRSIGDNWHIINALDSKGNYSATSNNTKLVYWPLMSGLLHLVQRGGAWVGCGPARFPSRCIAIWCYIYIYVYNIYCCPLLCGFNVAIKGLRVTLSRKCCRDTVALNTMTNTFLYFVVINNVSRPHQQVDLSNWLCHELILYVIKHRLTHLYVG